MDTPGVRTVLTHSAANRTIVSRPHAPIGRRKDVSPISRRGISMRSPHSLSPANRRLSLLSRLSLSALMILAAACAGEGATAPQDDAPAVLTGLASGVKDSPMCRPGDRFLGRILISTEDVPGTWWYLTRTGFDAAGVTDYKAKIESFFGTTFQTLDDAVAYLVANVAELDARLNNNGYVCAYEFRGTRAWREDPDFNFYTFLVYDDVFMSR